MLSRAHSLELLSEAFAALKQGHHGGKNKPQKLAAAAVYGGAGAAIAAPAALGAAAVTAGAGVLVVRDHPP